MSNPSPNWPGIVEAEHRFLSVAIGLEITYDLELALEVSKTLLPAPTQKPHFPTPLAPRLNSQVAPAKESRCPVEA